MGVLNNERYEYSSYVELEGVLGNYFAIPESIILAKDSNEKRLSAFSYFSVRSGLDNNVLFSVNDIVKWIGRKQDRHSGGVNDKIIQVVDYLKNENYLSYPKCELTSSIRMEGVFNKLEVLRRCRYERFAIIYIDELKQILNYDKPNSKDAFLNKDIILLVFAYLRMKIFRRNNRFFPEEINLENKNDCKYDIDSRRERYPEAFDSYYKDIAKELSISERMVSKAVNILKEMELIYLETLPRVKYDDNWKTDRTIFSNTYKREGNYLLDSGEEYYMREIENKKRKLRSFRCKHQNKNNKKE